MTSHYFLVHDLSSHPNERVRLSITSAPQGIRCSDRALSPTLLNPVLNFGHVPTDTATTQRDGCRKGAVLYPLINRASRQTSHLLDLFPPQNLPNLLVVDSYDHLNFFLLI